MHYIELGKENKETLVLIHGFTSNKESWESQHILANHYHLIIPDVRAHGESEIYDNLSISQFAKDILTLLDYLKIQKAHFCGLSMGGFITQEIYAQQPKRVKSMILSNTASQFSSLLKLPKFLFFDIFTKRHSHLSKEEQINSLINGVLYHTKDEKRIESTIKGFTDKESHETIAKILLSGFNYLPMLPFVKVPILIISSRNDLILPTFYQKQTYLFCPKLTTKMVFFSECGHMSNIDQKEKYNAHLLDFLQRVDSNRRQQLPYISIN